MDVFVVTWTTDDLDEILVRIATTQAEAVDILRDALIGDDGPQMTDEEVLARLGEWDEVKASIDHLTIDIHIS